jgi:tetratricopeptide (TPR) repeat protein
MLCSKIAAKRFFAVGCSLLAITIVGCSADQEGKIPITTSSESARELYVQGRDLAENLRRDDARELFEKAIEEDSNFALAYLNLSFVQTNSRGFFENFNKAKALIDNVSEGERLMIVATETGEIKADIPGVLELLKQLVELYPGDERVHNMLAGFYFSQQQYPSAIEEYSKAIYINSDYAPPYNQLGYAYRFLGNYEKAEEAFRTYIDLIPDDPNPYDSYAEMLAETGKFDASIEYYRKALEKDPLFVASHFGVASNLNFKGEHEAARKQLDLLFDLAENDGHRRGVFYAKAVSYADEENLDEAVKTLKERQTLSRRNDDIIESCNDYLLIAAVLLEQGKTEEARKLYDRAWVDIESSGFAHYIIDNWRRYRLYHMSRFAIASGDLDSAKIIATEYQAQVKELGNKGGVKLAHMLLGIIALESKDFDEALNQLQQADQRNAYNMFRMAQAYEGKNDPVSARRWYEKAANAHSINSLSYAFIRLKAQSRAVSI